jgi:hypothetical protein
MMIEAGAGAGVETDSLGQGSGWMMSVATAQTATIDAAHAMSASTAVIAWIEMMQAVVTRLPATASFVIIAPALIGSVLILAISRVCSGSIILRSRSVFVLLRAQGNV